MTVFRRGGAHDSAGDATAPAGAAGEDAALPAQTPPAPEDWGGTWLEGPVRAAWRSHTGYRRPSNDDRAALASGIAAVADGVGSTAGGGLAAQVAVAAFVAAATGARDEEEVREAALQAHGAVRRAASGGRLPREALTTLTAAVVVPGGVVVVNVGDSPAWLVGPAAPRHVTQLHRRWDPLLGAWLLSSALGGETDPEVSSVLLAWPQEPTLRLVLATDGVLDSSRDPDPPARLHAGRLDDVRTAADRLVRDVLKGAATDNVTVAVLEADGPTSHSDSAAPSSLFAGGL